MSSDLNQLVGLYIAVRDRKQELEFQHKNAIAELSLRLEGLEQRILSALEEQNITGAVVVEAGRVERRITTRMTIEDEDTFYDWIHEKMRAYKPGELDPLHFLERRVAQKATKDYLEVHEECPPGVGTSRKHTIRVVKVRQPK